VAACSGGVDTGEGAKPAATAQSAVAAKPADALAKVGQTYITRADLAQLTARWPAKLAATPTGCKYILGQHIDGLLLENEARARGIAKDPAIIAKIEDYKRSLYKNSLMESLKAGQAITDEQAQQYFADHEEEFVAPDNVRVSLIETEEEKPIQEIYRQLKAGADFTRLAIGHSVHVSAKSGGDMGHVTRGQDPRLIVAVANLKPGEITAPAPLAGKWQILKVTERAAAQTLAPEERVKRARARMEALAVAKAFDALLNSLREKSGVQFYDETIKQVGAAPPAKAPAS
jgi:parvulin-like peptidyl-prolyl isomerase